MTFFCAASTATGQAIAAQDNPETATGQHAAVDDLTTAIMTGASPAEIQRLEASAAEPSSQDGSQYGEESNTGQGDDAGQPAGDLPPGEPKNAERIRLTGLQERDKGLVNAANIIARTEGISFDDAWRRVNGGDNAQAQAGQGAQPGYPPDASAHDDAHVHEAYRQHSLQSAMTLYEDLQNPQSALWQEANRIATDPSHPDYDTDLAAKANAPLMVAKLAAANLGIQTPGAWQDDSMSISQPGSNVRPAAATKQSVPPPPRRSNTEIARASEAAALDAIEGRTPPPARNAERTYLRL